MFLRVVSTKRHVGQPSFSWCSSFQLERGVAEHISYRGQGILLGPFLEQTPRSVRSGLVLGVASTVVGDGVVAAGWRSWWDASLGVVLCPFVTRLGRAQARRSIGTGVASRVSLVCWAAWATLPVGYGRWTSDH